MFDYRDGPKIYTKLTEYQLESRDRLGDDKDKNQSRMEKLIYHTVLDSKIVTTTTTTTGSEG